MADENVDMKGSKFELFFLIVFVVFFFFFARNEQLIGSLNENENAWGIIVRQESFVI